MDNTRAGLGAVETGTLRSTDVLTDVYLAAAWTAATKAASEMAGILGEGDMATEAYAAHEKAFASLNRRFLDDQNPGIAFALLKSGKAQPEVTSWPAFGLWRGVFEPGRPSVAAALDALAGSRLGADWGARMLSNESALYDHESYNNGLLFFERPAAFALYEHDRPTPGGSTSRGRSPLFSRRAATPRAFLRRSTEVLSTPLSPTSSSRARVSSRASSGSCRHRVREDLPRIPAADRLRSRTSVTGDSVYDLDWTRRRLGEETIETWTLNPPDTLPELRIEPRLPLGAKLLGRASASWTPRPGRERQTMELRYRGGIEVAPVHEPLRLGERSSRLRVLDERLEGSDYVVRLEGRRGRSYRLRVEDGTRREIEISIPDGTGDWGLMEVRLPLSR
jgi:hypothetical protein